jgi:hypothetical protein
MYVIGGVSDFAEMLVSLLEHFGQAGGVSAGFAGFGIVCGMAQYATSHVPGRKCVRLRLNAADA